MPSGKLLDVGCATGDFLSQAKNLGHAAEGLELSRWSSDIARKRRLRIYLETLQSLSSRFPKQYDIVTLWCVIEHFEHPGQEMAYINKLLKRGGHVALWTGDVDSIVSRLFGRRWWYWQGQHIQYFTRSSLNLLAEKSGFENGALKIYPFAANYEQLENSLSRYAFQKMHPASCEAGLYDKACLVLILTWGNVLDCTENVIIVSD
jgi:SAM-dependent methyltransferase